MFNAFAGGFILGIVVATVAIALVAMIGVRADERRKP